MKAYDHPDLSKMPLEMVMHALADPCRVTIVRALLAEPELACNELPVDVAKATLSHHLDVLRAAGLIKTRVVGAKCLSSVRRAEMDMQFPGLLPLIGRR